MPPDFEPLCQRPRRLCCLDESLRQDAGDGQRPAASRLVVTWIARSEAKACTPLNLYKDIRRLSLQGSLWNSLMFPVPGPPCSRAKPGMRWRLQTEEGSLAMTLKDQEEGR
jgi:hypothetical protein